MKLNRVFIDFDGTREKRYFLTEQTFKRALEKGNVDGYRIVGSGSCTVPDYYNKRTEQEQKNPQNRA